MFNLLFKDFLAEKPYKKVGFPWLTSMKRGTPQWIDFNVVVDDELLRAVKAESARLEVSLTTLLYTALVWWLEKHKPVRRPRR